MNLMEFLSSGYTPYHVVNNCKKYLLEQGFVELNIADSWKIQP